MARPEASLIHGAYPPQPAQHARHLRAEHAAIGMRLVNDDVLQMAEELGPQRMVGQDTGVQHVGVGEQHAGGFADAAAALGRVAVISGRERVDDAVAGPLDERLPLAELILRQRLGGIEIERPRQRVARQRLQHRRVEAERLAAGRRGGHHHMLPIQRGVDRLGLVRVQSLGPGRGQRGRLPAG